MDSLLRLPFVSPSLATTTYLNISFFYKELGFTLGRVLLVGTTVLEDSEYLSFTGLYKSQRNYNFKAWACLSEAPGTLQLVMLK